MKFEIIKRTLENISNEFSLEEVKGIVVHSIPEYFNDDIDKFVEKIFKINKEKTNAGFHYVIDGKTIYSLVEEKYMAMSLSEEGKETYINKSLFDANETSKTLSVFILVRENQSYVETEEYVIKFLVSLLRKHKLKPVDVWRGFDLRKDTYSPLHILDRNVFEKYIKEMEKFIPKEEEEDNRFPDVEDKEEKAVNKEKEIKAKEEIKDEDIEIVSPFKEVAEKNDVVIDQYVFNLFKNNLDNPKAYASKFQPWDKGRNDAREVTQIEGDLKTRKTPYGNTLQYKITENAPLGLDHSEQPVDFLEGIETPEETLVEPIYPDLITPPGDEVHIADGFSETKVQSKSNISLTPEEFEKKQKMFDFSKFSNMKKETKGRPVNTEDPFPVDDQIKKLEEHYPKVKVDKVKFDFKDSNHPGSEIGNAMAKNYAMSYDMVMEVAKRTEQRLVKLENNLSTVMRNLFRVSSRININCTYYGGQSIYGKYKCIRCLHDDRINDGAIVSLDQCMNCTRYEPILGQVYAILDETGSNIVQKMDDMQMSYMGFKEYRELNSVTGYHEEPLDAKVNQHPSEPPKDFLNGKWKDTEEEVKDKKEKEEKLKKEKEEKEKDKAKEDGDSKNIESEDKDKEEDKEKIYPSGFKMDWALTQLETQTPHINTYETEGLKAEKKAISSKDKGVTRRIFDDTREGAVENETLEFDVKDYQFDDFGNKTVGSSSGNNVAMEVRNKIVDYAKEAVKLCSEGKAKYSQEFRYKHGDDAIKGISYWDCSSLVQRAYEAGGISGIGTNTATQFPYCLDKNGGKLFMIDDVASALPGDMIWFKAQPHPKNEKELQEINYTNVNDLNHVAIYIGNSEYVHATYAHENSKEDIVIKMINTEKDILCFGRPKALIELDSAAGEGIGGNHHWSREFHGISDELWNKANVADENVGSFVKNMEKYNYKDILINVSKEKGFDPYLTAALIAVESSGDPRDNDAYAGLMQVQGHYGSTTRAGMESNIRAGIDMFLKKRTHLKNNGWKEENVHVAVSAYNSGEGTVVNAGKAHSINLGTCKIPEMGEALYKHVRAKNPGWNPVEKQTYATKVLRAYNIIYTKNYLGLPQESNNPATFSGELIRPVPHVVTSPYGNRVHPISGKVKMHTGVDFGSPMGYPVKSSAAGTVRSAKYNGGWGNQVIVDHGSGKSTMYAHLSSFSCKPGQKVAQGQEVGKIGSTGASTGPHLHYEIHINDKHTNPMPLLKNS